MNLCDWIVALFCLSAGIGIIGFWLQRLVAKGVALSQPVMRFHLAAELITGAVLTLGAIATFVDARAPRTVATVGLGLGLLVYASVQSPPFYPEDKRIRATLWLTAFAAVGVFLLRVATL
jgi:hypothetical protein